MIFTREHVELILRRRKTQTRRLVEPGDTSGPRLSGLPESDTNRVVYRNGRVLWYTGGVYAVVPGRGQRGVGRFRVLAIRRERVQEITPDDMWAEGIVALAPLQFRLWLDLWDSLHRQRGTRAVDDPPVWALSFVLDAEHGHDPTG